MKFSLEQLKLLPKKARELAWFLGLHAFSVILAFIFIGLIFGALIFFNYVFLAERRIPQTSGSVIKFNEKVYKEIMQKLPLQEPEESIELE